jgi:hypothetical protein
MADPIDFVSVPAGARLALADGSVVEVVDNPRDGMWLICRQVLDSQQLSDVEQAVFVYDVSEVLS